MKKVNKTIMNKIADDLAMGKSLVKILKDNPSYPSYRAITNAVRKDDELYEIYRRGRVQQAEYFTDSILDLATSQLPENMDVKFLNAEVQRRRLEVDSLKWSLGRLQPWGLKDKKEEAGNTGAVTLSWSNGNVEVKAEE
tara:strand:- start:1560 stop:1976 length:417 start_codon:yes stop_codon:yes gene_type:complete